VLPVDVTTLLKWCREGRSGSATDENHPVLSPTPSIAV
jgi:hypothetical protein